MKPYTKPRGFFDDEFRLELLSKLSDPLVKMNEVIDWVSFQPLLQSAFPESDPKKGGRPAFDRVMMFKVLILQQYYGLSDQQAEFQINDRLSFMRFLGLKKSDKVPDEKTIWLFREQLTQTGVLDQLFDRLTDGLKASGLVAHKGSIVDASIVQAPIQRNTREENERIREGDEPQEWSEAKRRQKDVDADWTKRKGHSYFGYKNHIKVDRQSKLITEFETSTASVHDSQMLEHVVGEEDSGHELYADSAYRSRTISERLRQLGIRNRIHAKGVRGKPLGTLQRAKNRSKSATRARVEHVFGFMRTNMKGLSVRCIGLARATARITLMNIVYNIYRCSVLIRDRKLYGLRVCAP